MKKIIISGCCVLLSFGWVPAWAHHGGGGTGGTRLPQSISEKTQPAQSNINLNIEYNLLDEGVGDFISFELTGKYRIHPRFNIGLNIPYYIVRQKFVPNNEKLGDIGLLFQGVIWHSADKRHLLSGFLNTSFPTGDDKVSLGAESFVFFPGFSYTHNFGPLELYSSLGVSLETISVLNPTLNYEVGVIIPILKEDLPLKWVMNFQGRTFFSGNTFESGSTKALVQGGLYLPMGKHWEASFLGRFSVLDTLNFREDVSSSNFVTGFFNDIKASFNVNFGYRF